MPYQITMVETTPTLLAAVRKQTSFESLGGAITESLNVVYAFLKTASVQPQGHNVVVYLDGLATVEIGVQVSATFQPTDAVICSSTPGGLTAKTVHLGPYAALPQAHAAVRAWCTENAKVLAGPNWEVYGDWTDDPQNLRTDVYYLLKDG